MTSLERRREARYQRRKAAREEKKWSRYAENDNFYNIARYRSLFRAAKKSTRNVSWKASVQRYQMNLLRNMEESRSKLMAGKDITKGFVEFDTVERGKKRHIRSVHFTERVIQRSTCDNALVPMLSRSLIYDNGACLEGKGVDWAMDRLKAHLQQFYRSNGFSNDGWAVLFDFSGYFDNILHKNCFAIYSKQFRDEQILKLLRGFIVPFGYPGVDSNWLRVKRQDGDDGYTGKSLGLGSQISQITAVSYPNCIDHYVKQALRVRFYGRYMDDGYMFHKTKEAAKAAASAFIEACKAFGIKINERKTKIVKIARGFKFLKAIHTLTETGAVVRKVCRESVTRTRRKLKKFAGMVAQGLMKAVDAAQSVGSWKGYALRRGGKMIVRGIDKLFKSLFGIPAPRCRLQT